jgi:hypothetical protein
MADLEQTIERLPVYTQVAHGDEVLIPIELVKDVLQLLEQFENVWGKVKDLHRYLAEENDDAAEAVIMELSLLVEHEKK